MLRCDWLSAGSIKSERLRCVCRRSVEHPVSLRAASLNLERHCGLRPSTLGLDLALLSTFTSENERRHHLGTALGP